MDIVAMAPKIAEGSALLDRARGGDADAFCQLAEAHEQRLLNQAVVLCGQMASAEDLVQQTLVEAWKSLRRFDGRCRLSTWLYAILVHRYQKMIRAARTRPVMLASLSTNDAAQQEAALLNVPAAGATPAELMADKEQSVYLREWLGVLSEKHRQVILLRFFEEASLEEIAAALGCSVGTVKSRLHHALERLRKMKTKLNPASASGDTLV
jgi:RNA polymerase sigma-70 factor (ECF subfamily)